jgi:hypothetical protein
MVRPSQKQIQQQGKKERRERGREGGKEKGKRGREGGKRKEKPLGIESSSQ